GVVDGEGRAGNGLRRAAAAAGEGQRAHRAAVAVVVEIGLRRRATRGDVRVERVVVGVRAAGRRVDADRKDRIDIDVELSTAAAGGAVVRPDADGVDVVPGAHRDPHLPVPGRGVLRRGAVLERVPGVVRAGRVAAAQRRGCGAVRP